jgi:hypothetical protein
VYKQKGSGDRSDRVTGKVQNADGADKAPKSKRHFKNNSKKNQSKGLWIQPAIWDTMSKPEQDAHRKKVDEMKVAAKAKSEDTEKKPSLPMQYNAQTNQFTVTDNDGNLRTFSQTSSSNSTATVPTSNTQRAVNLLNSTPMQGGLFTVNNLRVTVSTKARHFVSAQNNHENATSLMCIDGGTNISLMGCAFRITTWSNRYADMCGFADELVKSNVRIGSGVSVYEYNCTML